MSSIPTLKQPTITTTLRVTFYYVACLLVLSITLLACREEHAPNPDRAKTDALVTATLPDSVGNTTESVIKVVLPDFAAIVNRSQTPTGKLDRITTRVSQQYSAVSPPGLQTTTQQFLYDDQGRIVGHTVLDTPSKGIDNAVIYTYKDNHPHRIFRKVAEYGSKLISFYWMIEMVYDGTGREVARLSYRLDLNGNARLQQRYQLIYDAQNRLIELKAADDSAMGHVLNYEQGNLVSVRGRSGSGILSQYRQTFRYDKGVNPLKGLNWDWDGDRWYDWSENNLVSTRTVYDEALVDSPAATDYTNTYDEAGRLIRKASSWTQTSISSSFYYQPE